MVAILILFLKIYKLAIHASGKFVTPLIAYLNEKNQENLDIPTEILDSILETQKLVVLSIKKTSLNEENEQNLYKNIRKISDYLLK